MVLYVILRVICHYCMVMPRIILNVPSMWWFKPILTINHVSCLIYHDLLLHEHVHEYHSYSVVLLIICNLVLCELPTSYHILYMYYYATILFTIRSTKSYLSCDYSEYYYNHHGPVWFWPSYYNCLLSCLYIGWFLIFVPLLSRTIYHFSFIIFISVWSLSVSAFALFMKHVALSFIIVRHGFHGCVIVIDH